MSAILSQGSQKMIRIRRGKRSTLEVTMFILCGKCMTLDVSCCMVFANPIVKAASSDASVQIAWQAFDIVRVSFRVDGRSIWS